MARFLTRPEIVVAINTTRFNFGRMKQLSTMSLAFGVSQPTFHGRYLMADAAFLRTMLDLSAKSHLPQRDVATLIRLNDVVVLDAIVRAEVEKDIGLALIEARDGLQLINGTEKQLWDFLQGPKLAGRRQRSELIERVTTINITAMVAGLRRWAKAGGFELDTPLFMMPDDPRWPPIKQELMAIRDETSKRLDKAMVRAALRQRVTENLAIQ